MELLKKMSQGEIGVKIDIEEMHELEKKIVTSGYKRLLTTIVLMVIAAGGVSLLIQYSQINLRPSIGIFSAVLFLLLLFFLKSS